VAKADGRRIEGRKVIVDRELGRTRKDWLPRRLGGGKGDSRRDRKDEEVIRQLKQELDQEDRAVSKGQKLDKLQEKPLAVKAEQEDAVMGDKQPDSDRESVERRKERSHSRSRERETDSRADDYKSSRRTGRRHHRDYSPDRHYSSRYNTHIDHQRDSGRDRDRFPRREKEQLIASSRYLDTAKIGIKREREAGEDDEREPGEL
jgi:U1 small nuclear ribonucleoprotein